MSYHGPDNTGAGPIRQAPLALAITAALLVAAGGARATESWRVLLTHQLQEQQRCTLAEILSVREVRVGSRVGLEGRIRCADTREFDFLRENENQRFTIRLCEPVAVC
jgi:hypothetical protein